MSDHELEKIRLKKAEMLMKLRTLPKQIIEVHNIEQFDKLINGYDKIIVLDFWAIWCGPCKGFSLIFEKLQQEYQNEFVFAKVNIDETPIIAQQYRISGVPTTLFIKKGQVINKIVGAMNYNKMKMFLERLKDYNH
ncbi:MAG: thioredoxin [Promethearchaeota archaeon]